MNLTSSGQDYIKAIYLLQQRESPVTNGRLATHFRVSAPSVTEMVQKLHRLDLVDYHPREGVRLTAAGEQAALELIRHHRLLELYLVEALGMTWDEVHAEAEVLEHVLSEAVEERIAAYLGDPQFDPHGAPIPARDGSLPQRVAQSLATLTHGVPARVVEVDDGAPDRLRYLAELGLVPQTAVVVAAQAPFDGPLTLHVGESATVRIIDARLAALIRVQSAVAMA
jgi:DtxR family Mn-dependent transcriptional regulator